MGQAKVKRESVARIQAVLDAAVEWRKDGYGMQEGYRKSADDALVKAIVEYENGLLATSAIQPDAPADLNAFRCPHCDAERPPYGWHFNIGDTGPFALQWITCFCGECKGVLGVSVVQFLPHQELVDQLKRQFSTKLVT